MFNPRFPHTLSVKRPRRVGGQPVIDENGDAIYDTLTLTLVDMMDSEPLFNTDGTFRTHTDTSVKFGYREASRNSRTAGDVVVSDHRVDCPMLLTEFLPGDILEITDYERSYKGTPVKKTTYNLGTIIWFDEIKN